MGRTRSVAIRVRFLLLGLAVGLVSLLHRHGGDIVREAEALLAGAGFQDLGSGEVGVRNLRFVRGTKAERRG